MGKLGMTLVAAGFFTTGIVVGNVSWDGSESIGNIEGNVGQMENEISEALSDNQYLTEQFNALMVTHNESINEANEEIQRIDSERNKLSAQIEELQQVADGDYSEDEAEIQAEIVRLESELQKANAEVAELETFVQQAADRSSYEAIDRSQFDAEAGGNLQQGAAVTYTDGLVEVVGQDEAFRLASSAIVSQIATDFGVYAQAKNASVTKVTLHEGYPAFVVESDRINYYSSGNRNLIKFVHTIGQPFYTIDSKGEAKFYD